MSDARLFRWLMQHASSEGSRSTALKPLGWLIGMLLASMVAAGRLADSLAIVVVLCVFCGMTLAVYLGASGDRIVLATARPEVAMLGGGGSWQMGERLQRRLPRPGPRSGLLQRTVAALAVALLSGCSPCHLSLNEYCKESPCDDYAVKMEDFRRSGGCGDITWGRCGDGYWIQLCWGGCTMEYYDSRGRLVGAWITDDQLSLCGKRSYGEVPDCSLGGDPDAACTPGDFGLGREPGVDLRARRRDLTSNDGAI